MKILRRLKKLQRMSGAEIGSRISDVARRWQDHCLWRARNFAPGPGDLGAVAGRLAGQARKLVSGASRSELSALESADPELWQLLKTESLERANRLLAGECELFGFTADIRGTVDWHRDPRSTHCWPRAFYSTLDLYELPDGIDVKYVWELNRHQFLVELSRGWLFTGDERFAVRVRELLLDWIEANPLYEGVNWTSALEAAVRAISWLWTLAGLADWSGWQSGDWPRIAASLIEHARYLERHFSLYSSPYNHLIGEAAGLFLLGAWLEGFPAAEGWRRKGRKTLLKHGPRQFYRDGFCVEQATGYHFFTLGFLAHALATSQRIGEPLAELRLSLAQAFSAGAVFMQPDGLWPAVGDVDSARALPVLPESFWDFRSMYGVGAVLCSRPALAEVSIGPGAELYWLEGTSGIQSFAELGVDGSRDVSLPPNRVAINPSREGDGCRTARPRHDGRAAVAINPSREGDGCRLDVLPESGYYVMRSGTGPTADWLLFDCGPIADGLFEDGTPSTAHGHADPLQVLLHLGGRALLVDPGMPFYFGPREWVDWFRGASAHNTIEIEGCPVARHAGRLAWSHVRHPLQKSPTGVGNSVVVSGTIEPAPGNSVTRSVRLAPGQGAWIVDVIRTDRERKVRWSWQVPWALEIAQRYGGRPVEEVHSDGTRLVQWTGDGVVPVIVTAGGGSEPVGWYAPGYGTRIPGANAGTEITITGQQLVVTYVGRGPCNATVRYAGLQVACLSPGMSGGETALVEF